MRRPLLRAMKSGNRPVTSSNQVIYIFPKTSNPVVNSNRDGIPQKIPLPRGEGGAASKEEVTAPGGYPECHRKVIYLAILLLPLI